MKIPIVHCKKEKFDIYIGRPSKWGNPFSSKAGSAKYKVQTKAQALYRHKQWVLSQPDLMREIKSELKNKILGCWCDYPNNCHGYILWQIANGAEQDEEEADFEEPKLF